MGSPRWVLMLPLSSRWRGDYGGKKQLWFPSNYVEEISSPSSLEPEREVSWGGQWGGARVRGADPA